MSKWLPVGIAAFIGVGVGVCIALWFKLPDHTVDVFALVESALGIGFTAIALMVTLGILRQRADFEAMLLTRRDEMEQAIQSRIEVSTYQLRSKYLEELMQTKNRMAGIEVSLDSAHQLIKRLETGKATR